MIISTDWIKDFVDLPTDLTPEEVGQKFTMATAEVEDVLTERGHLEKIFVGHIKSFKKHPEADKLNLVTVDYGNATIEVVCGASNVRDDLKIAYAPVGVKLPNGLLLEPKKIRGVVSEGMICSEEELGFSDESEGILELPEDAPIGTNLLEFYQKKKDILLDIDNKSLTHRPDLWGHYGLAREFAAVFHKELKVPYDAKWAENLKKKLSNDKSPIIPKVDKNSCSLGYFGLSVDNVKIEPSPQWMQDRLNAVGMRPINNIVDISNYVMMELGHPLHIFDRSKIKDNTIHIRLVGKDEKFTTLDEMERDLIATDSVIADSEKPLVIAGIMGGLNSGVDENSKNIFIEVANWQAADVRRTSTRLGLRTDSSQRYEKTLDSQLMERTLLRTLELVLELCPGAKVVGKIEYDGPKIESSNLRIKTSVGRINKLLGKEIPASEIRKIFESLDFELTGKDDHLEVKVPSFRATKDVEYEADLIEEIGRIVGYDHIEPNSPMWGISTAKLSPVQKLHRKIKDFCVYQLRALEVMSYPLVGEKLLRQANWPTLNSTLKLVNALSEDADRMRPSLVPSLLEKVAMNQKNFASFRLFELGRSYWAQEKNFSQDRSQIVFACFSKTENQYIKTIEALENLLETCAIPAQIEEVNPKFKNPIVPDEWIGLHPHENLNIQVMGKAKGKVFTVHPLMLRNFKIKGHLSLAVLDLADFEAREMKDKVKYRPLPKFPASHFDCTVVAKPQDSVDQVLKTLKKLKIKELDTTKVVGVYVDAAGKKSVTLRSTFLDPEKTLSGDFISEAEKAVVEALGAGGFPLKPG